MTGSVAKQSEAITSAVRTCSFGDSTSPAAASSMPANGPRTTPVCQPQPGGVGTGQLSRGMQAAVLEALVEGAGVTKVADRFGVAGQDAGNH